MADESWYFCYIIWLFFFIEHKIKISNYVENLEIPLLLSFLVMQKYFYKISQIFGLIKEGLIYFFRICRPFLFFFVSSFFEDFFGGTICLSVYLSMLLDIFSFNCKLRKLLSKADRYFNRFCRHLMIINKDKNSQERSREAISLR